MDVSVLIPTYNGRELLARLLESLRDAEPADGFDWEIIVIDNNSTDDTKSVVEAFRTGNRLNVTYIFAPEPGKTRALNRGLSEAAGTFVAFLDHDVVVAHDYVTELRNVIRSRSYNVFGGRVVPTWSAPPPAWVLGGKALQTSRGGVIVHDYGDEPRVYAGDMRLPIGCNFVCRRSLFDEVGLFNINLGPRPGAQIAGEETDLFRRLQAHGEAILYAPSIRVFHPVDPARLTKSYFRYRYFCHGRGVILVKPPASNLPRLFGVPRFLYRLLLESAGSGLWAVCRGDSYAAFDHQLDMWYAVGAIVESRRAARSGPKE
jgi:glycosyltransferase involved in cell wall biosynthesis